MNVLVVIVLLLCGLTALFLLGITLRLARQLWGDNMQAEAAADWKRKVAAQQAAADAPLYLADDTSTPLESPGGRVLAAIQNSQEAELEALDRPGQLAGTVALWGTTIGIDEGLCPCGTPGCTRFPERFKNTLAAEDDDD